MHQNDCEYIPKPNEYVDPTIPCPRCGHTPAAIGAAMRKDRRWIGCLPGSDGWEQTDYDNVYGYDKNQERD